MWQEDYYLILLKDILGQPRMAAMLLRIRYMAMATGRVAARKALHFCNTSRHTTGSRSPK